MSKVIKSRDRITMKGKSRKVNLKTNLQLTLDKNVKSIVGQNVLGYIEGTDKKDELVILSAHYDHLGKRGESIYNGADDNGSGTTAVVAKKLGRNYVGYETELEFINIANKRLADAKK